MNLWRARCGESRSPGSEGGPEKRTSRKADTALRSDPYSPSGRSRAVASMVDGGVVGCAIAVAGMDDP